MAQTRDGYKGATMDGFPNGRHGKERNPGLTTHSARKNATMERTRRRNMRAASDQEGPNP